VTFPDPEIARSNPVEEKHLMLSRGQRSLLDHDLKPNIDEKKMLEVRSFIFILFAFCCMTFQIYCLPLILTSQEIAKFPSLRPLSPIE
jgi:hypothetical protein